MLDVDVSVDTLPAKKHTWECNGVTVQRTGFVRPALPKSCGAADYH